MNPLHCAKPRPWKRLPEQSLMTYTLALTLAVAPIIASADNLFKCMGDDSQIYYQDIKCVQTQEALGVMRGNARLERFKISPRKDGSMIMLANPGGDLETPNGMSRNTPAQPKS